MLNCREPKRGVCPVVGRIRPCAGKPQWISSPSPSPLGHNYLLQPSLPCSSHALCNDTRLPGTFRAMLRSQRLVLSRASEISCHGGMVSLPSCHLNRCQGRREGSCVETTRVRWDIRPHFASQSEALQACCEHWGEDTPAGEMVTSWQHLQPLGDVGWCQPLNKDRDCRAGCWCVGGMVCESGRDLWKGRGRAGLRRSVEGQRENKWEVWMT